MKRLALAAFALMGTQMALADEYGTWLDLAAQKNFNKKLSLSASADLRGGNKNKDLMRASVGVGLDFKPSKWLALGTGYSFIADNNLTEAKEKIDEETSNLKGYNVDDAYWRNKHRFTADVTGNLTLGRFTLSLRERYQYTKFVATSTTRTEYRTLIANPDNFADDKYMYNGQYFASKKEKVNDKRAKDRHYLRSRVGVEYNIHHCAWTPYATYELSNDLGYDLHLDKQRLTVGTEWKVAKQHRLDFAYVFTHGEDDDNDGNNSHVLSIGYKFKF